MMLDRREWPDAGFPGIALNPDTLDAEIVDEERCESALALARGHVNEAAEILMEARYQDPESFKLKVLELDVMRAGHRNDRAVERAQKLLAEVKGTPREAVVYHYLGKIQFTRGKYSAAESAFSKALDLRVAASADASLIYTSTVALGRVREVLSAQS
jgi:tetratricopeptide (TPR) repeat protein